MSYICTYTQALSEVEHNRRHLLQGVFFKLTPNRWWSKLCK